MTKNFMNPYGTGQRSQRGRPSHKRAADEANAISAQLHAQRAKREAAEAAEAEQQAQALARMNQPKA